MPSSAPCLFRDPVTGKRCWEDVYVRGSGYCKEHQKPAFYGSSWDKKPKNWNNIVKSVIHRDKGLCYVCGGIGSQVDHKVPRYLGGTDDLSNLGLICIPCHKEKTEREAQEARYGNRADFRR